MGKEENGQEYEPYKTYVWFVQQNQTIPRQGLQSDTLLELSHFFSNF